MRHTFKLGTKIYYVPKNDLRLARYVPVTRLRLSSKPPLIVLGYHLVISPTPKKNGKLARTSVGSYWQSREAYEAYQARKAQPLWYGLCRTVSRSILTNIAVVFSHGELARDRKAQRSF